MGEHATALQLDTLAAGLPIDAAVPAHVAGCPACQAKLEAVKSERAAVLRSPQFDVTLNRLQPTAPPQRRPWGAVLGTAAVLLLLVLGGRFLFPSDGTILKGAATVELLKDGTPVTQAKVGDRLTLAVGGSGAPAVAVFTRDAKGAVEVLVPWAPLGPGARVPVGSALEVTPGSLTVVACFGKPPIDAEALKGQLAGDAKPADGCVTTQLEVLP